MFLQNLNYNYNISNFSTKQLLSIEKILEDLNVSSFKIEPINGDASKRRYYRVITPSSSYILMDSSLEKNAFNAFKKIDRFLIRNSIHAPKIYAEDDENNYLLLEDFGKFSYKEYLLLHPEKEEKLYLNAISLLKQLSKIEIDIDIKQADESLLLDGVQIFFDWFAKSKLEAKHREVFERRLLKAFEVLLQELGKMKPVVALRDYHAENLYWLSNESGLARVGVIDFQDAVLHSPMYDLVSILEDARRKVDTNVVMKAKTDLFDFYNSYSNEQLDLCYHILSLQRNLRIVGIFYRLSYRDKKVHYLEYVPLVLSYIQNTLKHPALKEISSMLKEHNLC
jgi:aminoglycoside/choline kinase family phosphotransferase